MSQVLTEGIKMFPISCCFVKWRCSSEYSNCLKNTGNFRLQAGYRITIRCKRSSGTREERFSTSGIGEFSIQDQKLTTDALKREWCRIRE
jgi:hypothetical protein